jgi:hypothetical protein
MSKMKNANVLLGILFLAVMTGCATPTKMGITKETSVFELKEKRLFLLTAELKNNYHPSYQPDAYVVHVETTNANTKSERLDFIIDKEGTVKTASGNSYMLRMMIDHGEYIIRGMSGYSGIFPVRGLFFMPLHSNIKVEDGEIIYLGRVKGIIRERQKNEFRAGPVIPLIDQAVTGFSGGTFDVEIVDASGEDINKFKTMYPALSGKEIKVNILPPFDRRVAQEWWEKH